MELIPAIQIQNPRSRLIMEVSKNHGRLIKLIMEVILTVDSEFGWLGLSSQVHT